MTSSVMLGGGGVAGIAWELGILSQIAAQGVDPVATADLIVGTSAGACVAAQVASGVGYRVLTDAQRVPVSESKERLPPLDFERVVEIFGLLTDPTGDREAAIRTVGALALAANTVSEEERREIVASRLPSHQWPEQRLWMTAVDVETGALVVLDRESDVPLVDAVAASCAVPGIWPPVTVNGRRYMDGGVRSVTHTHLAAGYDRVLVLSPASGAVFDQQLAEEREMLGPNCDFLVVTADEESIAAFGMNPLDPQTRAPALAAGRRQGALVAAAVHAHWAGAG